MLLVLCQCTIIRVVVVDLVLTYSDRVYMVPPALLALKGKVCGLAVSQLTLDPRGLGRRRCRGRLLRTVAEREEARKARPVIRRRGGRGGRIFDWPCRSGRLAYSPRAVQVNVRWNRRAMWCVPRSDPGAHRGCPHAFPRMFAFPCLFRKSNLMPILSVISRAPLVVVPIANHPTILSVPIHGISPAVAVAVGRLWRGLIGPVVGNVV